MNHLVNLVFLWIALYFSLPLIKNCGPNGCYDKLVLVVVVLGLQSLFHVISRSLINKNNKKPLFAYIKETLNVSLMKGCLVLLGYLIFMDLTDGESDLLRQLEESTTLLNERTLEVSTMLLPTFVLTGFKCFLAPY